MEKESKERLYRELNHILELMEDRRFNTAKREVESLIQDVIYNKIQLTYTRMNINPTILVLFLFVLGVLFTSTTHSQVIYITTNKYEADYILFITDSPYNADWKVYSTDNKYEARRNRGRWYFTTNKYEADYIIYLTKNRYESDRIIFRTKNRYNTQMGI